MITLRYNKRSCCYPTVPSAISEIFSEFLMFYILFHEPLGEIITKKNNSEENFCKYCTGQRVITALSLNVLTNCIVLA